MMHPSNSFFLKCHRMVDICRFELNILTTIDFTLKWQVEMFMSTVRMKCNDIGETLAPSSGQQLDAISFFFFFLDAISINLRCTYIVRFRGVVRRILSSLDRVPQDKLLYWRCLHIYHTDMRMLAIFWSNSLQKNELKTLQKSQKNIFLPFIPFLLQHKSYTLACSLIIFAISLLLHLFLTYFPGSISFSCYLLLCPFLSLRPLTLSLLYLLPLPSRYSFQHSSFQGCQIPQHNSAILLPTNRISQFL